MALQDFFVAPDETIMRCIKVLDETGRKIALVVEDGHLVGVVTDGDVRRWLLKNGSLEENTDQIMTCDPITLQEEDTQRAKKMLTKYQIEAIPILNEAQQVVDLVFFSDIMTNRARYRKKLDKVPVVVMAGGKGTRLYPYTKILPKPLIPIGEQTILERILECFNQFGCQEFYLTLNYKKNMIKAYLEDFGSRFKLNFIEEEKFLGTAGSLSLLKETLHETFILTNCDILVDADYTDIVRYHKKKKNKITMVTSLKNYTIPYGVIKVNEEGCISEISEKPAFNFQVNTGFYVLEPEVLADIPEDTFYHLTDLVKDYLHIGKKVGVYPVMENAWLDMGELKEMENMINRLKVDAEKSEGEENE
jgi:dTDP-glucose pyrophosphorylase